ncbi:MAG: hypothetical protein H8E38_00580 [SAR324 cluster bacterium]|nr:hypothetical protein [SAR324 cluster bacterium]MBL7035664.1 hypothetical protein [SAR324 cluster bacterium]
MEIRIENKVLQNKIFKIFAAITLLFVVFLLVVLPYRLYTRDVQATRQNAREISDLLRSGLLSTMINTGESEMIRSKIHDYQKHYDFKFRMIRSQHVEKQHGVREDEQAADELLKQVLKSGKSRDDWIDRTTFRYVAPFIADERCQECHEAVDGNVIAPGQVLGASEIIFDLSKQENDSVRLIFEIVLLLVVSLFTMSWVLYLVIKKGLIDGKIISEEH